MPADAAGFVPLSPRWPSECIDCLGEIPANSRALWHPKTKQMKHVYDCLTVKHEEHQERLKMVRSS